MAPRQRKSDKHLPQRVYKRSGAYYYYVPPAQVAKLGKQSIRLGKTLPEAMIAYGKLMGGQAGEITTVSELIDRYLSEVSPNKAPATYRGELIHAGYLRAFFGDMPVDAVERQHVYQYLDIRGESSPVSANREKALLSVMMKAATRWGLRKDNPCTGVERLREAPRDRYVEEQDLTHFLSCAPDWFRPYTDLKLMTGLRKSDLLAMKLADLRDDGIHVEPRKGRRSVTKGRAGGERRGKQIVITWTDELRAVVAACMGARKRIGSLYLFANRLGQPYIDESTGKTSGFDSIWQRAMTKAVETAKAAGLAFERFTEHDLRAKAASDAESLSRASEVLDHSSEAMTKRVYRRKAKVVRPFSKS